MNFGFSYVGLLFLLMLFVPNLLWVKHRPQGYDACVGHENRVLVVLERIGEVCVTALSLIFSDFNWHGLSAWALWLVAAAVLMLLYEGYWIRYFRSAKTMRDFYGSFLGIPVAGATLPVAAFLMLAVYGKNAPLFAAAVLLGIGHIGIHLQHRKEIL